MAITQHVSDDLLFAYASGSLDEGASLLVATHLALCPRCRQQNAQIERFGGYMLESLGEEPVSHGLLATVMSKVRTPAAPDEPKSAPADASVPEPLRGYLGGDLDSLNWVTLAPRVHQIRIATGDGRSQARLLRFRSGTSVPVHGHRGRELTLVLTGALCDGAVIFRRGDVAETDERTEHKPYAGDGGDCVCLAITDAPLRFKGLFARALQPLFGI